MPQLVHGRRRSSSSGKFATEDLRANPRWPRLGPADDARHKGELAAQLQVTLESRVLIEQAKGS